MLTNILIGLLIIGIIYLLYHQGKLYEEIHRLDMDIEQLYNEKEETVMFITLGEEDTK